MYIVLKLVGLTLCKNPTRISADLLKIKKSVLIKRGHTRPICYLLKKLNLVSASIEFQK